MGLIRKILISGYETPVSYPDCQLYHHLSQSEDITDLLLKPGNIFFVQAVIRSWPLDDAINPTGLAQDFEMLGYGGLGDGQIGHDVPGDAAWVGHQKFHNLKADGITQSFEHTYQFILLGSGNIKGTTGFTFCLWMLTHNFIAILR